VDQYSEFACNGEYEIKAKGHLDEAWSSWFEDMAITTGFDEDGNPVTTFTGLIVDQAALHGVIAKIRDIHMPLISVNQVDMDSKDEPLAKGGTKK